MSILKEKNTRVNEGEGGEFHQTLHPADDRETHETLTITVARRANASDGMKADARVEANAPPSEAASPSSRRPAARSRKSRHSVAVARAAIRRMKGSSPADQTAKAVDGCGPSSSRSPWK